MAPPGAVEGPSSASERFLGAPPAACCPGSSDAYACWQGSQLAPVPDPARRARALERGCSHRCRVRVGQSQVELLEQPGQRDVREQVGEVLAQAPVRAAAESVQVTG